MDEKNTYIYLFINEALAKWKTRRINEFRMNRKFLYKWVRQPKTILHDLERSSTFVAFSYSSAFHYHF